MPERLRTNAIWERSPMVEYILLLLIFIAGFACGYGMRSLRSRTRWSRHLRDSGW